MDWPRLGLITGGFCRDFVGTWGALNKFKKHPCLSSSTTTARVTSAKRLGKPLSPEQTQKRSLKRGWSSASLPLSLLSWNILSGLYRTVTLNGLQVNETTDSQPLLVALPLVNHSVNMSDENPSRLQKNGLITLL
jgi:hypothetical protein